MGLALHVHWTAWPKPFLIPPAILSPAVRTCGDWSARLCFDGMVKLLLDLKRCPSGFCHVLEAPFLPYAYPWVNTVSGLLQGHPGTALGDQGFDLECLSLPTTQPRGGSERKEGLSLKSLLPSSASGNGTVPSTLADIPASVIQAWQRESLGSLSRLSRPTLPDGGTSSNDRVMPLHAHYRVAPLFLRLLFYIEPLYRELKYPK